LAKAASKKKKVADKVADKPTDKLDKRTIERFRKLLLKEREEIIGDVKQSYESSQEVGQDGIQDIGDEAANVYNKQILLTLNENERMRLKEVDEALDRIASKTYGTCEECGEPIGLKRLEVKPVAKYCVPCKTKLEKGKL
jgi:DnaK suppressor protein